MKTSETDYHYSPNNFNLMTSLLTILNNNTSDDTYFVLAKYFLQHFDQLAHISIYDVAEQCFVSRSSIQRFAKYIGFNSFTDMKKNSSETQRHLQAFLEYSNRASFDDYLGLAMNDMMKDITEIFKIQNFNKLIESIHQSDTVVILIADIAGSSAKVFQQCLIAAGKLVRIGTDSTANHDLLCQLTENDLLITVSMTGNYAYAIREELASVQASKNLITLNYSHIFEEQYNTVFYLSRHYYSCDHISSGLQNVYTRYAASYFFDLLFNLYTSKYTRNQRHD